jgi:pilus assembly protein TadC
MYEFFANFFPKNLKKNYIRLIAYSNIGIRPEKFMGFVLLFGFVLAIGMAFIIATLFDVPVILLIIGLFILIQFIVYYLLMIRADKKARFVESILPDALQLMASNLRAGLTIDNALLQSARPEFGPLQEEINKVGKEVAMGRELEVALKQLTKNIFSEKLNKTVILITTGLRSGGQLASLLEQTSRNLREQNFIDEKIRANVMMYVIFVFVAVGVGSPLLFGLSSFLVGVITKTIASVTLPDASVMASMPIAFSEITISTDFVIFYSICSLIASGIMGSMIIGLISKGKEKYGVKMIPVLIILSLGIFFLVRIGMQNLVGSLLQI